MATKKVVKKTAKKATKKTAKKATGVPRVPSDIRILKALAKGQELTRGQIREATGISKGYSKLLGAATRDVAPESLQGRKMVQVFQHEGQRALTYKITTVGKKYLSSNS